MMKLQIIDQVLLDKVIGEAKASPRLRMNYNFHADLSDKCQRLLNALELGTVMPIHRHKVDEMQILLQGSMKVMVYNDEGKIIEEHILNPKEEQYGVQIPANTWHSLECLESGTVFLEVKEGPYIPNEKGTILEINK